MTTFTTGLVMMWIGIILILLAAYTSNVIGSDTAFVIYVVACIIAIIGFLAINVARFML